MGMASLGTSTPNAIAHHRTKQYSHDGVKAGAKAATIAFIASAIPLMMGAWAIPWARANLNYAAQAHIISLMSGAAYFVVVDKDHFGLGTEELIQKPCKSRQIPPRNSRLNRGYIYAEIDKWACKNVWMWF